MKNLIAYAILFLQLLLLLLAPSLANSQTVTAPSPSPSNQAPPRHRWELGLTLARVNLPEININEPAELNTIQLLPGFMARYDLGRWALRAGVDYTRNITHSHTWSCNDCPSERLAGTNFELRTGATMNFSKQKDRFYGLAELFVNRYSGQGRSIDYAWGSSDAIIGRISKGIGCQLGIGFRWPILKKLSLGTELLAKEAYTSIISYYAETTGSQSRGTYAYRGFLLPQPTMRIYAMFRL